MTSKDTEIDDISVVRRIAANQMAEIAQEAITNKVRKLYVPSFVEMTESTNGGGELDVDPLIDQANKLYAGLTRTLSILSEKIDIEFQTDMGGELEKIVAWSWCRTGRTKTRLFACEPLRTRDRNYMRVDTRYRYILKQAEYGYDIDIDITPSKPKFLKETDRHHFDMVLVQHTFDHTTQYRAVKTHERLSTLAMLCAIMSKAGSEQVNAYIVNDIRKTPITFNGGNQ